MKRKDPPSRAGLSFHGIRQRPTLPGVPPCAGSATGGAHGGNLTKYNVGRWLENDLEEGPDGMHKEKAPDIV